MKIIYCSNSASLFTLSVASSMSLLERLKVEECNGLKHLVTDEGDGHDHINCSSIFPNLRIMILENLPELRDISVGPKNILGFQNLSKLTITGCKQLKVIFSASILGSLPQLSELVVSNCEELVHIIVENGPNSVRSYKKWFPKLSSIHVDKCKSLKFLSTCGMLPNLEELKIEDAPDLVQVFAYEQGETEELVMEDVLSKLSTLELINLPSLHSFCQRIEFQTLETRVVRDCPKISLTSSPYSQLQEGPEYQDYEVQAASSERELPQVSSNQSMPHIVS